MSHTKKGTQGLAKTRMASFRHQEREDKEEENRQARIHPLAINMRYYKINQRFPQTPKPPKNPRRRTRPNK
jgi:hypothetical protein